MGAGDGASAHRPEFEAALRLFARATSLMVDRGCAPPILVGGAAVKGFPTGQKTLIRISASAMKREAMLARQTSSYDDPIPYEEFVAGLAQRRAALGDVIIPRNAGTRRTASKRALLEAIEKAGGRW